MQNIISKINIGHVVWFTFTFGPNIFMGWFLHNPLQCIATIWLLFLPCKDRVFGNKGKYFHVRQLTIVVFSLVIAILGLI